MRKFAMWLVWNVPLGAAAPWVMGFAVNSWPHKMCHYKPTMFQRRSNIHPSAQIDYDLKWLLLLSALAMLLPLFAVVVFGS